MNDTAGRNRNMRGRTGLYLLGGALMTLMIRLALSFPKESLSRNVLRSTGSGAHTHLLPGHHERLLQVGHPLHPQQVRASPLAAGGLQLPPQRFNIGALLRQPGLRGTELPLRACRPRESGVEA